MERGETIWPPEGPYPIIHPFASRVWIEFQETISLLCAKKMSFRNHFFATLNCFVPGNRARSNWLMKLFTLVYSQFGHVVFLQKTQWRKTEKNVSWTLKNFKRSCKFFYCIKLQTFKEWKWARILVDLYNMMCMIF